MTVHSGRGWRLAPSLVALENEFNRFWPRRSQASDGSIGDRAHRHRVSDHNPVGGWVTAIDITNDPRSGLDVHAQMRTLASRGDRRIKYLISNHQIWEPGRGWRPYSGENPHTRHAHISVENTSAARDNTSPWLIWLTGNTPAQPPPQPSQPSQSGPQSPPSSLLGGKPMQIVHVPDSPKNINPDTWFITDGIEARPVAQGEPEWYVMSGLIPRPSIVDGKIRPVPMPWASFSKLRR